MSKVHLKKLDKAVNLIEKKIKSNSQIFVCGNGGSAAIANHYVCDFLKFFRQNTTYKPKIISLSLLGNLALFFLKLKFNKDEQSRGILFSTFLYGLVIVILKFI